MQGGRSWIQIFKALKAITTVTLKFFIQKANCYKMMLLTGSKEESTKRFYENAGYNSSDKTAFIRWLT